MHQLIDYVPPDFHPIQLFHDLLYDVLLTLIGIQRKAGFGQQIGQLYRPKGAELPGAIRLPGAGGAVNDDLGTLDCNDSPVVGHSPGRRVQVPPANNDIVLFKKEVVSPDLTAQPLIIIQIAFDLVARQAVGHRHQVAHRVPDAFFLDPDLTVGCLQIGNQDVLDFLRVHTGLPVTVVSRRSAKY